LPLLSQVDTGDLWTNYVRIVSGDNNFYGTYQVAKCTRRPSDMLPRDEILTNVCFNIVNDTECIHTLTSFLLEQYIQ